ncbi:protein misato homolog 1 isoform X2 [Sphaerodactylus townsendi]|uniref:protein misato homolog 1 isoform X2 n=1 Tax=Sphaerodactylus townsendi TaxID=933632 RepID=UPI002025FEB1|nr:protein misato homolog 1 isoform X2 [Sphaerodactylus townsendi]
MSYVNHIPQRNPVSPLFPFLCQVVTAVAATPFPMAPSQSLPDALCTHQSGLPWSPLSSCGKQGDSCCFAQSVVLRGIAKERLVSKPPPGCEPKSVLHMCETGEEVLARYLYTTSPTTLSTLHLLQEGCQLRAPYPQFFSPLLDKRGFLLAAPTRASTTVESIPVISALQSSALLHRTLGAFYKELHQLDVRRWASFFSVGVELDDFQEALEQLRTLSHCYRESGVEEESGDEED